MVTQPLPRTLVARLRRLHAHYGDERAFKLLGRMENVDFRNDKRIRKWLEKIASLPQKRTNTNMLPQRVRALDVSRNFPGIGKVVIKRVHSGTAPEIIVRIKQNVKKARTRHAGFYINMPHAYAIGGKLVAMAYANAPATEEITLDECQTNRGKNALKMLEANGISRLSFAIAARHASNHGGLLFTGIRKGKPIFTPLIDLF